VHYQIFFTLHYVTDTSVHSLSNTHHLIYHYY